MKYLLLSLSLLFFLTGCSTKGVNPPSKTKQKPSYKPTKNNWITTALYQEYEKWYKTPYKYGGETLKGVDCSSFIQSVYYDAFKIKLPRTTKEQVKKGYFVKRAYVKEGDLLFFKTSYNTRHTGILLEKDKFIHTSTKYGVTMSSLNNPYWKSKYWQARRLLILE